MGSGPATTAAAGEARRWNARLLRTAASEWAAPAASAQIATPACVAVRGGSLSSASERRAAAAQQKSAHEQRRAAKEKQRRDTPPPAPARQSGCHGAACCRGLAVRSSPGPSYTRCRATRAPARASAPAHPIAQPGERGAARGRAARRGADSGLRNERTSASSRMTHLGGRGTRMGEWRSTPELPARSASASARADAARARNPRHRQPQRGTGHARTLQHVAPDENVAGLGDDR